MNKGAVSGLSGRLKVWTLILGGVTIGLLAHSTSLQNTIKEHEVFFGSVIAVLVISAVFLLLALIGLTEGQDLFKTFDTIFHVVASLLLIASGIAFIINVDKLGNCGGRCKDIFAERISAGTIGLINGVFYGYIAWILH